MGGRINGESPREEKLVDRNCSGGAVRPYQTKDSGDTAMAITATQASKQQLAV